MSEVIIAALITGGCAIFAQFLISRQSSKDLYAKLDKQSELADAKLQANLREFQAVTNEKIDELSRRVEKHNNLVERTYRLEENSAVMVEKMRSISDKVEDLERMTAY